MPSWLPACGWYVAFAAVACYFLIVRNSDILFMAQSKSLFYFGEVFWSECMQLPGGLLSWIAGLLTEFFYIPALGGGILIALWLLLAGIGSKAFKVGGMMMPAVLVIPFLLLTSTVDLGYWLYYLKFVGYFFVPTLGLLWVVGWASLRLPKKGLWSVLLVATYPLFGFYSLLAMAVSAIGALKGKGGSDEALHGLHGKWYLINVGVPLIASLITPLLWYRFYSELAIERAWTVGIPMFEAEEAVSWTLSMPFVCAMVWLLVLSCWEQMSRVFRSERLKTDKFRALWATLLFLVMTGVVHLANFDNYNYKAEMRMYKAATDFEWDEVLQEAAKLPGDATREMVILKNIALFYKGTAGDQFFHYNNMGEPPYVRDSLKVHMVQTSAPLLYMHHGKTNFSVRWCIENSVEYGYSHENLQILALCALVGEEYKLARKYLDILSNTVFYKKWAERYLPATRDTYMMSERNIGRYYPELANIADLRRHMGSVLDGDNGLPEMYLISYFSHSMNKDSKLFNEMTLVYALVQKDIQLFWPRFMQYALLNTDKDMPIHYQEAAYLYGKLEPESMDISHMPFDDSRIVRRYERFNQVAQPLVANGMTTEQVGEAMKSTFGDTFWWFYFFCRDIKSY